MSAVRECGVGSVSKVWVWGCAENWVVCECGVSVWVSAKCDM